MYQEYLNLNAFFNETSSQLLGCLLAFSQNLIR